MADIRVYGIPVSYSESGSGAPVVFLHEVGGDRSHFKGQTQALQSHARCLYPDLPGHGKTGKIHVDHSIIFCAEVMLGFLAALELEDVTVVGHGFGAAVALAMAQQKPDAVPNLILMSPPPMDPDPELAKLAENMNMALDNGLSRAQISNLLADYILAGENNSSTAATVRKSLAGMPRHIMVSAVESVSQFEPKYAFLSVTGKVLCLNGSQPKLTHDDIASLAVDARFGQILLGSHFLQLSQKDQVNAALATGLDAIHS